MRERGQRGGGKRGKERERETGKRSEGIAPIMLDDRVQLNDSV